MAQRDRFVVFVGSEAGPQFLCALCGSIYLRDQDHVDGHVVDRLHKFNLSKLNPEKVSWHMLRSVIWQASRAETYIIPITKHNKPSFHCTLCDFFLRGPRDVAFHTKTPQHQRRYQARVGLPGVRVGCRSIYFIRYLIFLYYCRVCRRRNTRTLCVDIM